MNAHALQPDQFPMDCPHCGAKSGMPYLAASRPQGGTSVGMRCRHCAHEWHIEVAGMPFNPFEVMRRAGGKRADDAPDSRRG